MFTCSACFRRAIWSLAADLPASQTPSILGHHSPFQRASLPSQRATTSVRRATTLRSLKKGHHRRTLVDALSKKDGPPEPNARRNKAVRTKVERRDLAARENNEKHLATPDYEKKLERQALKEAVYLVDPLRLANEVERNLKIDNLDKALALVRASDKKGLEDGVQQGQVNNIVSWNHLCDWCMAKGDPRTALKIYNEMKKRGHRPDAHTYTIMLRGFGENIRKPNAVGDAMKVYNSMFEPNSKFKPNTIHTNAIISVCAKGNQMDDLWSVAGRLPDKGPGGADHFTFTIILKALERDAIANAAKLMAKDGDGGDASHLFDQAVEDGRKLWRDVIIKWRRADLRLDESLVCAMGRLLLLSKKRSHVLDVFRLVEQTMGVRPSQSFEDATNAKSEADASEQQALAVFTPVPAPVEQLSMGSEATESAVPKSTLVQPGNNTLSMLMEAALLTKQPHVGKGYWGLLTSPTRQYQVAPDTNNIVAYLRLLRFSRASRDVIDVLQHEWPEKVGRELNRRGVYVIAMSTCVRDKNNPNVFKIASKIVDIMQSKTSAARSDKEDEEEDLYAIEEQSGMLDVDPQVMAMYLNLAMYTTRGINPRLHLQRTQNGDLDFEREPMQNNTMRALHRMGPDTINLKRLLKMKMAEMDMEEMHKTRVKVFSQRMGYVQTNESIEDLVGLVRAMVSAYDRILAVNERLTTTPLGPLREEVVLEVRLQKAKLANYLSKVDKKVVEGSGRGRSGVWEGYDPTKQGKEKEEVEEGEEGEVTSDTFLHRTPGGARLKKAVKQEEKALERESHGKRERGSRRQKQERETERREDRRKTLRAYDVKARTDRAGGRPRTGKSVDGFVQKEWGRGFEKMAKNGGRILEMGR